MTGAAMAALCVSGVPNTDTDIVQAKTFLKSKLIANSGAFDAMFGVNTDSNGWAVSGLNACGIKPQTGDFLASKGKTPVDFLISQQFNPGGGFKYLPSDTAPQAYASIDGLRAVAGGGFTAAPPAPVTSGAPQWVGQSSLTSGSSATFAVTVDDGSGTLKVCSAAVTATGTTTTLGAVLDAASGTSTPSGCVSGVTPSSGTGQITSLNGKANSGSDIWKVSVDGAAFADATRGRAIGVGDTIALRWGA